MRSSEKISLKARCCQRRYVTKDQAGEHDSQEMNPKDRLKRRNQTRSQICLPGKMASCRYGYSANGEDMPIDDRIWSSRKTGALGSRVPKWHELVKTHVMMGI